MKKSLLILPIIVLSFFSCKKNKTNNNANTPVYLRDKSIPEIKSTVLGKWKIHYSYGGFTGNVKTLTPNSFFKVLANDSVYLSFDNVISAETITTYQRVNTAFGYSAVIMNFPINGGPNKNWIVDYLVNDSLVLDDNIPSGNAYIMTKIP